MKSVLLSIQPQWCELIASGKKTIEVRKSAPKETPFKVYIYQSKWHWIYKILPWLKERRGKVIGEFICDRIEQYEANERGWYIYPQDEVYMWTDDKCEYEPFQNFATTSTEYNPTKIAYQTSNTTELKGGKE